MTEHAVASGTVTVGEHPHWDLFGLTLNADTIISTVVAAVIVLALGFFVRAKVTSGSPNGVQLFFETVTTYLRDQIETNIGVRVAPFLIPISVALFVFLLICNWLSVLPLSIGGRELLPPPASDVNLVYPLALMVFVWKHVAGARTHHGAGRQLVHTLKGHDPRFSFMWVIEEITSVVSHSLRLFGNILAGGIMLQVIAVVLPPVVNWALNGAWKLFDMFIGAVQAFVFAYLTIIYFTQAMELREDH